MAGFDITTLNSASEDHAAMATFIKVSHLLSSPPAKSVSTWVVRSNPSSLYGCSYFLIINNFFPIFPSFGSVVRNMR
jgi:hypothetical protein